MQASVAADSIHSSEHNLDAAYRAELGNVDKRRTALNEVLLSEPLRDVYTREFGPALEAYNERQKRADRRIGDYYEHISKSKQEHLCYEFVVQIGDLDNNSAEMAENRGRSAEVYRGYLEQFQRRYGHVLKVFEAVIHNDEATPHMHLAFVPVVENRGKNGLAVKNSFRQAMREIGIENGRAVEFYHSAQEMLAEVMAEHGLEKTASRYDRANRGDMTQEEYVEFAKNQELILASSRTLSGLNERISQVRGEVAQLERTREQAAEAIDGLRDEVHELVEKRDELKSEVYTLADERNVLRSSCEELRNQVAEQRTELNAVKTEYSSLKAEALGFVSEVYTCLRLYADAPDVGSLVDGMRDLARKGLHLAQAALEAGRDWLSPTKALNAMVDEADERMDEIQAKAIGLESLFESAQAASEASKGRSSSKGAYRDEPGR